MSGLRGETSRCAIADALLMVERNARRTLHGPDGSNGTTDKTLQDRTAREAEEARRLRWTHAERCATCEREEENGRLAMREWLPKNLLRRSA